jgi:hypothetical protein
MSKRFLGLTCILIATLAPVTAQVQAFNFSFPFPGSSNRDSRPPPGPGPWQYQYRPQDSSNARGVPPSYKPPAGAPQRQLPGRVPGYQPGPGYQSAPGYQRGWSGQYGSRYPQQATRQAVKPPRVELELTNHQPYVQENVLLKLRVVSDQNLDTATPELPNSNDVLLHRIEGPNARSRTGSQGGREIVNEFVYTLTPLRAGSIEVPPLRVTGSSAGNGYGYGQTGGQRFEASSPEPLRLQVRPAMASVRPWLPLQDLALKATLDSGEEVEQGQPVTLALELTAVGAAGSQLPSLESLLRSPDFRVYREQTLNEGELSADGRRLEGRRTEYYTLVPRSGGKLQLPEIRLAWWNVTTGSREYAGLPIRTLQVDGEAGPFGLSPSTAGEERRALSWFWLPLVGLMLLLLGYWGGVWYKGRAPRSTEIAPLQARLGSTLSRAASEVTATATELAKRLNPAPLLGQLKPKLYKSLPPSTRFLLCVRTANREEDPAAWAERFTDTTCQHLQFDSQTTLPGVTNKILALRPGADREQVQRLMQQLDGALYGNQDIDFKRWKKQFRRQIGRGRGVASSSGRKLHLSRARLPELNPQPSF